MSWLTITIIAIVVLLCLGMLIATNMWEYEQGFVYFAYGMLVLFVFVAVYLAYAVPSVAELTPRQPVVTEQESDLLLE